jgi:hypothetical protein
MSSSPTVSNASDNPLKRRRTSGADMTENNIPAQDNTPAAQSSQAHIPKRGARACTSCRKGKNRCEGEVSVPATFQLSLLLTGPFIRTGPGTLSHLPFLLDSLHVVDANLMGHLVYSKNQRKRILRSYLMPA